MSHQRVSNDLVAQIIFGQETLQQEQQAIINRVRIIKHNLLLYEMISQLSFFPKGLLKEFHFALQQSDIEVILLLRNRITFLVRKFLKKV